MKWLTFIVTLCIGAFLFGCGSHSRLKSELDAYQPPGYYQVNIQSLSREQVPVTQTSGLDPDLVEGFGQLAQLKERWQQSALETDALSTYSPEHDASIAKLRSISEDPESLEAFLSQGFSLKELEALVLLRNPAVKAAKKNLAAALEGFTQVGQLDEILRQYAAFTEGIMPGVGQMKGRDPIQMKFPYPGVTALKGQVVNQTVKVANENLSITRRDAVAAARRAYWDLAFVVQAQLITGETLDLFQHLESVAATRYESGSTSYQDVIKVRIQRATLSEDLNTFSEQRQTVVTRIQALLVFPTNIEIGNPRGHRPPREWQGLERLFPMAHEHRQELRRLRAKIGKMERMIEMAETMILPTYSTNASFYQDAAVNQVGSFPMKEPFPTTVPTATGAGLPKMPWYGTQDAYLRETRQKVGALNEKLRQAEADTNAMVQKAWFKLDQALREVALYRDTIVDLSQTSLEVSTRGYEAGTVSFADVISSYTQWLKTRLALARKNSDLGIAFAELEQAVGVSLSV